MSAYCRFIHILKKNMPTNAWILHTLYVHTKQTLSGIFPLFILMYTVIFYCMCAYIWWPCKLRCVIHVAMSRWRSRSMVNTPAPQLLSYSYSPSGMNVPYSGYFTHQHYRITWSHTMDSPPITQICRKRTSRTNLDISSRLHVLLNTKNETIGNVTCMMMLDICQTH